MRKAPIDSLKPIRVQSVSDRVVEQIATLIRNGTFSPGDQLPAENDLAAALGVGRSTLREAKQSLIAMGLLTAHGRNGTFVNDLEPYDHLDEVMRALRDPTHRDLHEVREFIEIPAIRLACSRATDEQIETLYATMDAIEAASRAQEKNLWGRHTEIHRQIVRASGNHLLATLHELISQVLTRTQLPFLPLVADWDSELASHRRLIDALATRNADAAVAEMSVHLAHSDDYRHQLLRATGGSEPSASS